MMALQCLQVYMPHMSLLYADFEESKKKLISDQVSKGTETQLVRSGQFLARSIVVVLTDPNDKSMASWEQIGEFPLQGK